MKIQREHWASQFGFVMAAAGSAIGLGSLWRFPYTVGENGGGIFVLLYVLFTLFLALPIFIAELIIGRKSQHSPIFAYAELSKKSRNWKMIGWLNLITCFLILSFYCVIAGWGLSYVFMSLNQFYLNKTTVEIAHIFDLVQQSPGLNLFWLFVFILLNIGVVYGGIRKGIEYWSRILMPLLLFILVGLFLYGLTLKGFPEAARFILYPNWSKFTPATVLEALGTSLFTLSAGLGIVVTYGSYLKPNENIPKTGIIVTVMTLLVSLMAALMIFPIVFTYKFTPEEGSGLFFKIMPVLFSKLPGNLIISTVFFLLFVFTALTSSISLIEVLVANIMELLNWKRARAIFVSALAVFVFGIPSALSGSKKLFPSWEAIYGKSFLGTLDYLCSDWLMPISGLLTTLFIGWVMEKELTRLEFIKGTRLGYLFRIWFFSIRYFVPTAVLLIILHQAGILDISIAIRLLG